MKNEAGQRRRHPRSKFCYRTVSPCLPGISTGGLRERFGATVLLSSFLEPLFSFPIWGAEHYRTSHDLTLWHSGVKAAGRGPPRAQLRSSFSAYPWLASVHPSHRTLLKSTTNTHTHILNMFISPQAAGLLSICSVFRGVSG